MLQSNFILVVDESKKYLSLMESDGSSCLARSLELPKKLPFSNGNNIVIRINAQNKALDSYKDFEIIDIEDNTLALIQAIFSCSKKFNEASQQENSNHTCITWADNTFHYIPLYEEIWQMHTKYSAHYTFAEGYPIGVSPEIFSSDAIEMMGVIARENEEKLLASPVTRKSLFSLVELRINDFDIENVLAEKDMRELRISLCADTRRNFLISKKLREHGLENPNLIMDTYKENPEYFRTAPTYVYAQVSNKMLPAIYKANTINEAFFGDEQRELSIEDWENWAQKIYEFSPEAVLCLGYNGDPFYHKNIKDILQIACAYFSTVYVECSGVNWQDTKQEAWWSENWVKSITWIVSVDAYNKETYKLIYDKDNRDVLEFIDFLGSKGLKENIYVQAVRIQENENELEAFLKFWESKETKVIIQKYNDYCGLLENRKVVDLAPSKRAACFHLDRDFVLMLDGRVSMCAQSQSSNHIVGNIQTDSIEDIWQKNMSRYKEQVQNKFNDICRSCDEYYTVNQ